MNRRTEHRKREIIDALIQRARSFEPGGGEAFACFMVVYYRGVPEEDLLDRTLDNLFGAAMAHWRLGGERRSGELNLRIYNPDYQGDGWESPYTVVEMVNDDMPFLVDTALMILSDAGVSAHLTIHPILSVVRDDDGRLRDIFDTTSETVGSLESFMHIEIDRQFDAEVIDGLHALISGALGDVRAACADWRPMVKRAWALAEVLPLQSSSTLSSQALQESAAFLKWLSEDHFTFLSYAEYDLVQDGAGNRLAEVEGSGLGIRRGMESHGARFIPEEVLPRFVAPEPLLLTKANERATVHRRAFMDYVGVKRFDNEGRVIGECRFLGLYTSQAYHGSIHDIPLVRIKARQIMRLAGLREHSHAGKALAHILETLPREELFQASVEELYDIAAGILSLQGRQRTRLFLRRDPLGRFYSAIVLMPRERYRREARERVEKILRQALQGESVESSVQIGESVLAQIHVLVRGAPEDQPAPDVAPLEGQVIRAVRLWRDELTEILVRRHGVQRGNEMARRYAEAFPAAYRSDFSALVAARDIGFVERLTAAPLALHLYEPDKAARGHLHLKLYRPGLQIPLSNVLPQLENMGLWVAAERPYRLRDIGPDGEDVWIHDFELVPRRPIPMAIAEVRPLFEETLQRVWAGAAESDGFNGLVLTAGLDCRQTALLRGFYKYLVQAGIPFSQSYVEEALAEHAEAARLLVELFERKFDPGRAENREAEYVVLAQALESRLDQVSSLDHDRILRAFIDVIRASLRANYFQRGADGEPKAYLSIKLDPALIPILPRPLPKYEIWVYSPRTEGIHLRGGRVARGGIRWSDRREDFRTEVLGLMKAQMVKNAVIVPVGAKGGFVVKHPPAGGDRQVMQAEGIACYQTFISGLLDLTDNYVGGQIQSPPNLIRYDDDDPYLVVAADKGTASFSDIANEVARSRGFWLDDAFASGGSAGYDHKKMGITARGAWESVKRHFREVGRDIHREPFTVVGIGDMSGDVFGNGMLLSAQIRLVAAFNHRHIFIDPDPDPAASFEERKRLFQTPGSQWTDYDDGLISVGGGVFSRAAKRIELTDEMRACLGVTALTLAPDELIRAILRAPADLLWNGGIGTYVKASDERDSDVGDRSNDSIRVNGRDLRVRVVGEGGNLGFTQLGRAEFAMTGGRINTDFIDNAGGVNCSDREVNIKILLNAVQEEGLLSIEDRNKLLETMTGEVADLVLADNRLQVAAISLMAQRAAEQFDEHVYVMGRLESNSGLDRALEYLPDAEEIARRRSESLGLTRPELAVLLCYSKLGMYETLLASPVVDDSDLTRALIEYFPAALREDYRHQIEDHRLRREIIATTISNSMINRMGIGFGHRMVDDMAVPMADVARAYACAREIYDAESLWSAIEALEGDVSAQTQSELSVPTLRLLEHGTRWFLGHPGEMADIAAAVSIYADRVRQLRETVPGLLREQERETLVRQVADYGAKGVPDELAGRIVGLSLLGGSLDVVKSASETGRAVPQAAAAYFRLGDELGLDWLLERVNELDAKDTWASRARSGLRYDLYTEYKRLTVLALGAPGGGGGAEQADAWLGAHQSAVERVRRLLGEMQTAPQIDISALSVAVREIRRLADEG